MLLATADKARRAAELTAEGKTLKAIAKELGYASPSGVAMLLERYRLELPREALEQLRDRKIARLESVERMAFEDAQSSDPLIRDRGQRRVIRAVEAIGRISGIIRAPLPVVVVRTEQRMDLSRLSIDEVESIQRMQGKLLEAPITVQAETVNHVESSERNGDGDESGLGDRA